MATSNLSSEVPQMHLIQTPSERRSQGIGINYVDSANQARMAQYNNEYNYWLWQQQAAYNSPSAQRARLEAAGLNPNYQSIDGGNLSSIPSSSGSITPSVGKNLAQTSGLALQGFSTIIDSIKKAVDTTSELSGIPDDIGTARKVITKTLRAQGSKAEADMIASIIDAVWKGKYYTGKDLPILIPGYGLDGSPWYDQADWANSPALLKATLERSNLGLKNDDLEWLIKLRKYDFENIKPAELQVLQDRARQIGNSADLTEKQKEMYNAIIGTKIGVSIAPIALAIAKMIL